VRATSHARVGGRTVEEDMRVSFKLVKRALQLLSKRQKQFRFAHAHERILLLRSVELLTAITSDLPMKPERTRNKRLTSQN